MVFPDVTYSRVPKRKMASPFNTGLTTPLTLDLLIVLNAVCVTTLSSPSVTVTLYSDGESGDQSCGSGIDRWTRVSDFALPL